MFLNFICSLKIISSQQKSVTMGAYLTAAMEFGFRIRANKKKEAEILFDHCCHPFGWLKAKSIIKLSMYLNLNAELGRFLKKKKNWHGTAIPMYCCHLNTLEIDSDAIMLNFQIKYHTKWTGWSMCVQTMCRINLRRWYSCAVCVFVCANVANDD